jgi:hypothetical protein
VRTIAAEHLEPRGVEVRLVPTDETALREVLPGARLVWVETPSNPGLDVLDLEVLARDVHAAGALLAIDHTLATPLLQRPLALGADVSVASGSKALTGHSDLVLAGGQGRPVATAPCRTAPHGVRLRGHCGRRLTGRSGRRWGRRPRPPEAAPLRRIRTLRSPVRGSPIGCSNAISHPALVSSSLISRAAGKKRECRAVW